MSKDSPSAPAAPDYVGAAYAQGAANLDAARTSARLSNPNIVGPYGRQEITYDGDQPTVTQTLNPDAQAALQSQQATQKALADLGLQGTATAQSVMARLQPQIEQTRAAKETQLRNQGLVPGGEAYNNDMRNLGNQENDLRTQAALQGIGLDTAARAQGFGELQQQANLQNTAQAQVQNQGLQAAQFGNAAQQAELQRQLALRQQPLNEITGLMSGSQIQLPQFQQYTGQNVAPAPTFAATQAQGQNAMQQYGIAQSGANANTSGLYGLGGAALGAGGLYAGLRP